MVTLALALASLAVSLIASPPPTEVALVRSHLGPLLVAPLSGPDAGVAVPLGPASPRGFGLDAGRLRLLVVSDPLRVAVVEVEAASGGALFTLDLDHPDAAPIRVAAVHGVDLDLALAPDGRRLAYLDGGALMVADLARPGADMPRVLARAAAGERLERPRWGGPAGAERVAFERTRDVAGSPPTGVEVASLDGRSEPLVPHRGRTQDRLQVAFGPTGPTLTFVDGTLYFVDGARRTAIGDHFGAGVHGLTVAGALVTLGPGGVEREAALALVDATGARRELRSARPTYLDPLPSPDGARVAWSVRAGGRYGVEVVDVATGDAGPLRAPHAEPVELAAWTPDGRALIGRRADRIVAVSAANDATAGAHVLATATMIRGVVASPDGPVVVFERRFDDGRWQPGLVAVASGRLAALPRSASVVGVASDRAVLQTGFERGSAAVVAAERRCRDCDREIVPWQADGIDTARLADGGATVVWRPRPGGGWRATRVDAPGPGVAVTPDPFAAEVLGVTAERLVAFDAEARRVVSHALDGGTVDRPTLVLGEVLEVSDLDLASGRVVGLRADGTLVCGHADGRDAARPTRVGAPGLGAFGRGLELDRAHARVVVLGRAPDASAAVLSFAVDGGDAERPRVLAPVDGLLYSLEVQPDGDVLLAYARPDVNALLPERAVLAHADGSGLVSVGPRPVAAHPAPYDCDPADAPDDGREGRARLRAGCPAR